MLLFNKSGVVRTASRVLTMCSGGSAVGGAEGDAGKSSFVLLLIWLYSCMLSWQRVCL